MTTKELEKRVALLEAGLAEVQKQLPVNEKFPLEDVAWGRFAGNPIFLEAMKLGREYRESLRPKAKAKTGRRRTHARPRH